MTNIRFLSTTTVQPTESPNESTLRIELTPWDLQLLAVDHIQKGLLFLKPTPSQENKLKGSVIDHLKTSLSRTLDIFYPLAGRLVNAKPMAREILVGNVTTTAGDLLEHGLGWAAWQINEMIASQKAEEIKKGRPLAVRSGVGNKFDGKLTVFPGPEEGSIDFEACLSPETLLAMADDAEKATSSGDANVNAVHPMLPDKVEIFKFMEEWIRSDILTLLKLVEKSWQPQDFLPNPTSYGFVEQVNDLRERTKDIPDEYFVVLVGGMITEEALPTYQALINGTKVFTMKRVAIPHHGQEDGVQKKTSMDAGTKTSPYFFAIYTSFQERANTAKLAMKHGDEKLAQLCGTIAVDEKRHETAYTKIVGKLFELDPNETVIVFADMMRRKILMPAHLMYDGYDENLFDHFANITSRIGVYTAKDYREILEHLVSKWNIN
ncbi:hypothetical protein FH972_008482 [Carpinus fangiana]|uniref:Acyl-[acyl-carrier-protein] desaturase n=1 Tax=Carpinus fangiana TaxID=176857 RepID=A0A5N6R1X7_9ROSI|nr:hypothetical protein FH972_008482 [Carpinus fangiana]